MSKKIEFKKKLKVGLCKTFWYLFIFQSLYIIYNIAPKPADPIITMVDNFATLSGPNLVTEGKSAEYTLQIFQDLKQDVNITLEYSSTAKEGEDFIAVKNVVIKKDEFSKSFSIKTINDMLKEEHDVFAIKIKSISGKTFLRDYNASESSGVVFTKIVDEDKPVESTKIKVHFNKKVFENQEIGYTLSANKNLLEDLRLEYEVSSSDSHEYKKTGELLFRKGTKKLHFTIAVKDDNILEKAQFLEIRFKKISSNVYESVKLDKEYLKTTILDNKSQEKKEVAQISLVLKEPKSNLIYEDTPMVKIEIQSNQKILKDLKIRVHYGGSAIEGVDFKAIKEILILKGTRSTAFSIEVFNDNIKEESKNLDVKLELLGDGGLEKIVTQNTLSLTLNDEKKSLDKNAAKLSFSGPNKVSEAKRTKEYKLQLSQTPVEDLIVKFSYKESTAEVNSDFIPVYSVKILKGQKEKSFTIKTIDDKKIERLEKIVLSIDSLEGGGFEKINMPTNPTVTTQLSDEQDIANAFKKIIENKKIVFKSGSDEISQEFPHALNDIAKLLMKFPKAILVIEGHTNHIGNRLKNVQLSQRRANSVKEYIVSKGINASRLAAKGYGDSRPMVDVNSPNAVKLNKRVDFEVKYGE